MNNYYEKYEVSKGDSIYQIAKKYNINPTLLMALNGLEQDDYIYPNQIILIPKSGFSYYITKEGDTLETLSTLFSEPISNILNNNKTIYLKEGQLLVKKI